MGKDGIITRKDIIEDEALKLGSEYAKNMEEAIKANKELVASLKEMAPLVNTFRNVSNQQDFVKAKQEENLITLKAINANKLLEAAEISLEKIKKEKLLTEKVNLDVAAKTEAATRRNTKLTIEERVQNEINNKTLKQEARERLGLVSAYEKLNKARTDAKNKLRDLLAAETASTAEIKKAQKEYDILDLKVRKADAAVGDFSKNVGNYKSAFGSFASGVSNLIGAFGIVGGVSLLATVVKDVFNTTKELQSLDLALKSVTGTQEEFATQQLFLQSISEKYGLEIKNLTKQFIAFYVAAKDKVSGKEIQEIFENISKSGSALGLSNESLERSFTAINQMLSKGTVASEELRGQLAEAMPGAVQAMTKAVQKLHPELKNLTEKGLFEMIKDGKILASEVLPETSRQLLLLTGADKAEGIETLTKLSNRFSNSWTNMIRSINDTDTSGFGIFVKKITSGLTNILDFTALIFKDENQLTSYFQNLGKQKGFEEYQAIMKNIAGTSKENIELTKKEILIRERENIRVNQAIIKSEKEKRESIAGGDRALFHLQTKLEEDALVQIGKSGEKIKQIKLSSVSTISKAATPGTGETEAEKRAREKAAQDKLDLEQKLANSLYELQKQRLEQTIKFNNEIVSDDTQSDEIRLQALQNSQKEQTKLLLLTKDHLLENDKLTANDRIRINEDYSNKILDLETKTKQESDKITQFDEAEYQKSLDDKLSKNNEAMNKELAKENGRFNKLGDLELLSQKDREAAIEAHEREVFEIKKRYAIEALKLQISNLETELAANDVLPVKDQITAEKRQKIAETLSKAKLDLTEVEAANNTFQGEKYIDQEKETAKQILEISQNLVGALSDLGNSLFEAKISNIDNEISKSNDYYDQQIELAGNDQRQKAILEDEKAKKDKELEKKKRKAQYEQAVFNKAISATEIIAATSLAVISALAQVPKFDFGISASAIAGIYAGIGAIQLAAVLATPLPKYKMGRKGGPAELAVTGDGGVNEVISRPDGSGALITPNKPTLTFLQKDDIVHKSMADYNEYMRRSILKGFHKENEMAKTYHFINNNNTVDNSKVLNEIKEAIKKQKTNVSVTNKVDIGYEIWRLGNINWHK